MTKTLSGLGRILSDSMGYDVAGYLAELAQQRLPPDSNRMSYCKCTHSTNKSWHGMM